MSSVRPRGISGGFFPRIGFLLPYPIDFQMALGMGFPPLPLLHIFPQSHNSCCQNFSGCLVQMFLFFFSENGNCFSLLKVVSYLSE